MSFQSHLSSAADLVTPYVAVRAGFIRVALEKNKQATPYIEEARALKAVAVGISKPTDLLSLQELRPALLTAAGVSDKAKNHLTEADQIEAIKSLVDNFLIPADQDFVDELIFRFLLTKGDSLGGRMRNLAGVLAEQKMTRALISTLAIQDKSFSWLDAETHHWKKADHNKPEIERFIRGLSWETKQQHRLLIYNLTIPVVNKNVDLCLLQTEPGSFNANNRSSIHRQPQAYLALGELKGGIDPAGADEHWKTANTALGRIRAAFASEGLTPHTFFVGAAIETAMATEIYTQLQSGHLTNAANLTQEQQLFSLCRWLMNL